MSSGAVKYRVCMYVCARKLSNCARNTRGTSKAEQSRAGKSKSPAALLTCSGHTYTDLLNFLPSFLPTNQATLVFFTVALASTLDCRILLLHYFTVVVFVYKQPDERNQTVSNLGVDFLMNLIVSLKNLL